MLLLGHWPALVGADARLFELRPVDGIDGSPLMGHRVGSCAFSPITIVGGAIPIISVLKSAMHHIFKDEIARKAHMHTGKETGERVAFAIGVSALWR